MSDNIIQFPTRANENDVLRDLTHFEKIYVQSAINHIAFLDLALNASKKSRNSWRAQCLFWLGFSIGQAALIAYMAIKITEAAR